MTNAKLHTTTSAPFGSRELLKEITESMGFTPNIFAVAAESKSALSGLIAINGAFAGSTYTAKEQQVILMATSVTNDCVYCVAGHTLMAQELGLSENLIHAFRNDLKISNPRYATLYKTVKELVNSRGRIKESALLEFRQQGYSMEQFFELILGISVKTLTNYISNALALPLDDAFKPYEWKRPEEAVPPA